jgi:hypothetical protein
LGVTRILPNVATAPCAAARVRACVDGGGEGQHRIAAIRESGGAGVVGRTAEGEPPAAVRPDGRRDNDAGS